MVRECWELSSYQTSAGVTENGKQSSEELRRSAVCCLLQQIGYSVCQWCVWCGRLTFSLHESACTPHQSAGHQAPATQVVTRLTVLQYFTPVITVPPPTQSTGNLGCVNTWQVLLQDVQAVCGVQSSVNCL